MLKRNSVFLLASLAVTLLSQRLSFAQLAPTGSHYAGRSSDTGHEGPNDRGGYATSIPLDLPPAQDGLPVPVQIVSGGKGFGAAGVGWDVPLSYVHVDRSFSNRRPALQPNAGPSPRERITVSLPGRREEMLPRGGEWVGRHGNDLVMRYVNGGYKVFDGNGRTYTFVQHPAISDGKGSAIFLLFSITGRGGSIVELRHSITSVAIPNSTERAVSIDLSTVSYNRDPSATCFKNTVRLGYAVPLNPTVQSQTVLAGRVVVRDHRLGTVDVMSRADCNTQPVMLRQYALTYQTDPDTQQEQLAEVRMFGRNGTQAGSIPIVSYSYGTATSPGSSAPRVLRFPSDINVPFPAGPNVIADTVKAATSLFQSPVSGYPKAYVSQNQLVDMNGDGRPDRVFLHTDGKLHISLNTLGASGSASYPTFVPLTDNTLLTQYLDARASQVDRFDVDSVPHSVNREQVWRQLIDINGDGRMDIIDAAEKANHWVIYLNTPGTTASGITWVKRAYNVTTLYNRLVQLGHKLTDGYLPLSRRFTGKDFNAWMCWDWNGTIWTPNSNNIDQVWGCYTAGKTLYQPDPNPEKTYTEWEVRDLNGDGYPDFVFNSRRTDYAWDPYGWPGPFPLHDDHMLTSWRAELAPHDNEVLAVLNVGGIAISNVATATYPFSAAFSLRSSDCGVGLWTNWTDGSSSTQHKACGFEEVNGDGIVDRIESYYAYPGTGSSFSDARIAMPWPLEQYSDHVSKCANADPDETWSIAYQKTALRDVTGDGIPDFIRDGRVLVGTGAGFVGTQPNGVDYYIGTPTPIEGSLPISVVEERCDGAVSKTLAGLYDLDADGKPDRVIVGKYAPAHYEVAPLAGGSLAGAPESGKITEISNGFGAITRISYRSAKIDPYTKHQVPFPEIVVSKIETILNAGLGSALAPTEYSYGSIDQFYDSVADTFRSTGYRRRVELRNMSTSNESKYTTQIKITDSYALDPITTVTAPYVTDRQRFGRYLLAGRPRDITVLTGTRDDDVWSLLATDVTTDPRRVSGTHLDVTTLDTQLFTDATGPANEPCYDILFPYDYELSKQHSSGHYNVCSARGFISDKAVSSWRGSAAPPAGENVQTRASVRDVDTFGRPTSVYVQGDVFRSDDDYCVDVTYATPVGSDARVLSAVYTRKVWRGNGCSQAEGQSIVLAEEMYEYDKQYPSLVTQGLVTAHTVYRHATDTGAYLNTVREYDVEYNAQAKPIRIITSRGNAKRITEIDYDPRFAILPVHNSMSGSDTPTLGSTIVYNTVTDAVESSIDESGTVRGIEYDDFGRRVRETVSAGGTSGVLSWTQYLGFEGGMGARRIVEKQFMDPVAPNQVATAEGRTTTTYLDELGRPMFGEVALGEDYGNDTLIVGERKYDLLGRVAFAADPYPRSQSGIPPYGTTRFYDRFGAIALEVRGSGPQPYTTTPDAALERFPTLFSHAFINHTESMKQQTADALTPGTPQYGVTRESVMSAIGRVLSRASSRSSSRLELATFAYDPFGNQTQFVRYQNPSNGQLPVVWSWQFDSRGQVLSLTEPSSAFQERFYSDWGELERVKWGALPPWAERTIVKTYDAFSRVTHSEEQTNGVKNPETMFDFRYDVPGSSPLVNPTYVKGRLASASAPTGAVVLSYDALGRVNARSYTNAASNTGVYIEKHGFHADGSPAWVELNLPDNNYRPERAEYAYDSAGQVRWTWFSDGQNMEDLYNASQVDAWGRVRAATYGATQYEADFADVGRRLPRHTSFRTSTGKRSFRFEQFDAIGRELRRTEDVPDTFGTHTYIYDALGQLDSSSATLSGFTTAQWTFGYDTLGNLASLNDMQTAGSVSLDYGLPDRDRVCRINFGTFAGSACNVLYDSVGNVVQEATRSGYNKLDYFNSGNVRRIENESGAVAQFRYDPFGAVQTLDITKSGASLRADRHYGSLIVQRLQGGQGYLSRQFPIPGASVSRRGPNGPWIFQFAESRGTRFATDEHGTFVQDIKYQPFGEAYSKGAVFPDPSFSVEQWNEGDALETFGLFHLGARLYDPAIGRFLSRDPLLVSGTATTSNPYAFSYNDPINLSDPTGLNVCLGLCIWSSYPPGSSQSSGDAELIAGIVASVYAAYNIWTGTHTQVEFSSPSGNRVFNEEYRARIAEHGYLQRVYNTDFNMLELGLSLPLKGILGTACDLIACDHETGGGDTLVPDGSGGLTPDSYVPNRVSNLQYAINVGLWRLAGLLGEGRGGGRSGEPMSRGCPGGGCGADPTCFTAGTPVLTESGLVPIETVKPGDRVDSLDAASCTEPIDAASCRMIEIEMENPYGYTDRLTARFLQSEQWVRERNVRPGTEVPLKIDELTIDGRAKITSVGACTIQPGTGCLVTGTVTHLNRTVLRIRFVGSDEMLEPTATHRLWSADRGAWVTAGDLDVGERLVTKTGFATIASIEHLPGAHQVFNFEVAGAHTYLVSALAIKSHNTCPSFSPEEQAIADYLEGFGRKAKPNPSEGVTGMGRQGDALVDGQLTEFKTLSPGADAGTIKNTVNNSIRRGGQAREIIIDARGSGMTEAMAKSGAAKALGISRGKLDGLTLLGDGYFFRWTPR